MDVIPNRMGEQLNNGRFVRSGPCLHGSDKLCDFKSFLQGNHRNSLAQTDSLEFHSTSYQAPLVFNPPAKSCKKHLANCHKNISMSSPPLRKRRINGSNSVFPSGLSVVFSSKCWGMGVQTSAKRGSAVFWWWFRGYPLVISWLANWKNTILNRDLSS